MATTADLNLIEVICKAIEDRLEALNVVGNKATERVVHATMLKIAARMLGQLGCNREAVVELFTRAFDGEDITSDVMIRLMGKATGARVVPPTRSTPPVLVPQG